MDRTPDEVAYQLKAIANSAQNIISAVTSSAASPGGSITFRYTDHNGTRSVTGTAHTAISPGNVQAMRTDDGQWIVFGTPTSPSREALHESRRRRAKTDEGGKIKSLFSVNEGEQIVFYLGSDRTNPKKLLSLPIGATIRTAAIHNLGIGDRYLAAFYWQIDNTHYFRVMGAKRWEASISNPNPTETTLDIRYRGFGFWSNQFESYYSGWANTAPIIYILNGEISSSPPEPPIAGFLGKNSLLFQQGFDAVLRSNGQEWTLAPTAYIFTLSNFSLLPYDSLIDRKLYRTGASFLVPTALFARSARLTSVSLIENQEKLSNERVIPLPARFKNKEILLYSASYHP